MKPTTFRTFPFPVCNRLHLITLSKKLNYCQKAHRLFEQARAESWLSSRSARVITTWTVNGRRTQGFCSKCTVWSQKNDKGWGEQSVHRESLGENPIGWFILEPSSSAEVSASRLQHRMNMQRYCKSWTYQSAEHIFYLYKKRKKDTDLNLKFCSHRDREFLLLLFSKNLEFQL